MRNIRRQEVVDGRFEYLPNLEKNEDYRMNAEANLVAPLSRHPSLKLG